MVENDTFHKFATSCWLVATNKKVKIWPVRKQERYIVSGQKNSSQYCPAYCIELTLRGICRSPPNVVTRLSSSLPIPHRLISFWPCRLDSRTPESPSSEPLWELIFNDFSSQPYQQPISNPFHLPLYYPVFAFL